MTGPPNSKNLPNNDLQITIHMKEPPLERQWKPPEQEEEEEAAPQTLP